MKIFFILIFVCSLCNGSIEKITGCISDSGRNCANSCSSIAVSPETCTSTGNIIRSGCDNSCSGFGSCRQNAKCVCTCTTTCSSSDISIKTFGACSNTPIASVDHQMGARVLYNVISAGAGHIPGIGTLLDMAVGAYSPNSPITSAFQLADEIRTHINNAVEQLKDCMDEKITFAKVEAIQGLQQALLYKFSMAQSAPNTSKIIRLENVFTDFSADLVEIFGLQDTYVEYEGLLPVWQSLAPLYAVISAEQLFQLMRVGDNTIADQANILGVYNKLMQWILVAKSEIQYRVIMAIFTKGCQNMNSLISSWGTDFDNTYQIENITAQFGKIIYANRTVTVKDTLYCGEQLDIGEQLTSSNYKYRAVMRPDGDFVVYGPKGITWMSATPNQGGTHVIFQGGDLHLCMYRNSDHTGYIWGSGATYISGSCANAKVVMQHDGNLCVYKPDGNWLWCSNSANTNRPDTLYGGNVLNIGQHLISSEYKYRAVFQNDGNFCIYDKNGNLKWQSETAGKGGEYIIFQATDNHLVMYNSIGAYVWMSNAFDVNNVGTNAFYRLGNDGNSCVSGHDGTTIWCSNDNNGVTANSFPIFDVFKNYINVVTVLVVVVVIVMLVCILGIHNYRKSKGGKYSKVPVVSTDIIEAPIENELNEI